MTTLKLVPSECVVDRKGCARNVKSALARGLPVCSRSPRRMGKLAIVGSAPSVVEYLDVLKSWPGEIWAINGAYDFLRSHGIIPHGFVGLDPLPGLAEYVAKPHEQTTYFISSVCDPAVFDALKSQHVWLFHSKMDAINYPPDAHIVSGGTTALTRAPLLANMLGWRDMTVFGADSSYVENSPYCYPHGTFAEDTKAHRMRARIGDQVFVTELALMKQASQLGAMQEILGPQLKFCCGGLLGAFLKSPYRQIAAGTQIESLLPWPARFASYAARKLGYKLLLYPDHFGHQVSDVEYDLRTIDGKLLYLAGVINNKALYQIHKRLATVVRVPNFVRRYLSKYPSVLTRPLSRNLVGIWSDRKTWDSEVKTVFSPAEEAKGAALLEYLGLKSGEYVCFHAREATYGNLHYGKMFKARGINPSVLTEESAHQKQRNVCFADYQNAIAALARRGVKSVRVGAEAQGRYAFPGLVDYAAMRTQILDYEFADLYLIAKAMFYVGGATGVSAQACAFKKRIALVNLFPFIPNLNPAIDGTTILPKGIRHRGKLLSRAEIETLFASCSMNDILRLSEQIDVIDNDPADITRAVMAMHDRIDGMNDNLLHWGGR